MKGKHSAVQLAVAAVLFSTIVSHTCIASALDHGADQRKATRAYNKSKKNCDEAKLQTTNNQKKSFEKLLESHENFDEAIRLSRPHPKLLRKVHQYYGYCLDIAREWSIQLNNTEAIAEYKRRATEQFTEAWLLAEENINVKGQLKAKTSLCELSEQGMLVIKLPKKRRFHISSVKAPNNSEKTEAPRLLVRQTLGRKHWGAYCFAPGDYNINVQGTVWNSCTEPKTFSVSVSAHISLGSWVPATVPIPQPPPCEIRVEIRTREAEATLLIATAALFVAGTISSGMAEHERSNARRQCPSQLCSPRGVDAVERGKSLTYIALTTYSTSAALGLSGALLWGANPDPESIPPTPTGMLLGVGGHF